MLILYLRLRLKALLRLCKALKAFAPLIVLLAILIGGIVLGNAPKYYITAIYGISILSWHLSRKDRTFLQTCFQRKYVGIYLLDYALRSIPFITFFLIEKAIKETVILLLLSILIAFVPKRSLPILLPAFPFLQKGSYIYQRMGRIILPFYILILVASIIGTYIHNENLVLVTNFIIISGIGMFLYQPIHTPYVFNYISAGHLLKMKCKQAFWNAGIILAPLILCLLLVNLSWSRLETCAACYINGALFFLQTDLLRFICKNDQIVFTMAYIVLSVIAVLSIIILPFTFLSLVITLVLAFYVQSSLKKYLS